MPNPIPSWRSVSKKGKKDDPQHCWFSGFHNQLPSLCLHADSMQIAIRNAPIFEADILRSGVTSGAHGIGSLPWNQMSLPNSPGVGSPGAVMRWMPWCGMEYWGEISKCIQTLEENQLEWSGPTSSRMSSGICLPTGARQMKGLLARVILVIPTDPNRKYIPFHEHKHVHDLQSCKTLQTIFLRRRILSSLACPAVVSTCFNPAWSPFQETRPYLGAYPSAGRGFRAKKVCGHPTPAFHDSGSQNNENPPENQ